MAVEYELTLGDYVGILRRHLHYIILTFLIVFLASIVIAVVVPPVYQSTGTIMIESQQIPTDFVKDSVDSFADERIEVVKQRVMTRENLLKIIDKYQLFNDKKSSKTTSDMIDLIKSAITVDLISADVAQRGKSTIAFTVSFDYKKPEVAHDVANEIVTLFLAENIKSRTERATETTEFLEQEANRQKEELEKIETKVAAYKQTHANALPEQADLHMNVMQRDESGLRDVEREIKSTEEELRYLDIELASAKAGVGLNKTEDSNASSYNAADDLEKLKAEYVKLSAVYNEEHPTLRSLKRKIDKLESAPPASDTNASDNKQQTALSSAKDLMVAKVQAQIDGARSRKQSLEQQQQSLRASLSQMTGAISQTPQVALGLTSLLRDYDSAKAKYSEMQLKVSTAKVSENLEQQNKAERFSLLEPPTFPEKPTKPNRKKIIGIGFAVAIALGIGLAILMETIDGRLRGVEAISAQFNMKPLVVIPYIKLESEDVKRKKIWKIGLAASILLLIVAVLVVHLFVMPLDILISKLSARFN